MINKMKMPQPLILFDITLVLAAIVASLVLRAKGVFDGELVMPTDAWIIIFGVMTVCDVRAYGWSRQ